MSKQLATVGRNQKPPRRGKKNLRQNQAQGGRPSASTGWVWSGDEGGRNSRGGWGEDGGQQVVRPAAAGQGRDAVGQGRRAPDPETSAERPSTGHRTSGRNIG